METDDQKDSKETKPTRKKYRFLRILGRIFLGIILFLFLLVLFIRSPWGQSVIIDKVVSNLSKKTNTKIEVEKLFITFGGDIQLDGLYMEDKTGDTLIYSKSLQANVPLWGMIKGETMGIDALDWEGVRANFIRKDSINGFNFQFLLDAFPTADTTTVATDTTATAVEFVLGNLKFKDIDIVYNDAVTGIDSRFKVGELYAEMEKTDLENMAFEASEMKLANAKIKFVQTPVPQTNEESSPLPSLAVKKLSLENVFANYESYGDRIKADLDIKDLYAEIPNANLAENNFKIETFRLHNSVIVIHTETETNAVTQKVVEVTQDIKQDIQAFEWPDLRIDIGAVDFQHNNFSYFVRDAQTVKGQFNPNAIVLNDLNLIADNIFLKDKTAGLNIETSTFSEASGFNLKELSLDFNATDTDLNIRNLRTQLNENKLIANAEVSYSKLSELVEAPESSRLDVDISSFTVSLQEAFRIQPELEKNPYLKNLSKRYLTGSTRASGTLSNINIPYLSVNWGQTTHIDASGSVQNVTDVENVKFDIPTYNARTKRTDLIQFIDESELSVSLPNDIALSGSISGNMTALSTNSKLTTSQGIATVDGNFKYGNTIEFDADIAIDSYKMNELLGNDQLGTLSMTLHANGNGTTINTLDADVEANISSFAFNDYAIKDLKINGTIKDGTGNVVSKYKDQNLNMDLQATVVLDSIAPEANVELDIIGADLNGLGLMSREIKTGFKVFADFKGNATDYDVAAIVDQGVVVYDNKTYLIGDLNALAHVRADTTSVSIQNKMVDLLLQSNTDPMTFSKSMQRHVFSYFYRDEKVPDSITKPVNLKLRGHVSQAPLLNDVFLVNVKDLDTIDLAIDFNEAERRLKANITAPHINYSGYELDSLAFSMYTDKDKFIFDLGFKNITAGPFDLPKTNISGEQANNELSLHFSAFHDETEMMYVDANISGSRERLRFHVLPEKLILNKEAWTIPANNEIIFTENNLAFTDFRINKGNQSIEITDELPSVTKSHIALDFQNFDLTEVLDYLNPQEQFAKGILSGDFILEEPFADTGILADADITQFEVMDVKMGTFSLDAKSLGGNSYDFNAALKGGDIDLDFEGDYIADESGAKLNMDLDINDFKMSALNGFSRGEITDSSGSFSGHFDITGTPLEPNYVGELNFNNAEFEIAMLNTPFKLTNEKLQIDNSGLSMSNFTIRDVNDNTFVVSGEIGTETFINPTFNLDVKANDFQLLDATKEDNDWLYGKLVFDASAKITGDLQIPNIEMALEVGDESDVTYVMPTAAVNIEDHTGIVEFVNRENPDAILTQTKTEKAIITGFDVSALMKIGKDAAVTVIIDEETGDNFRVLGEGDFNFTMKPNGRMNLVGVYDVVDGHYEMNLYNLVNRRFEIAPGSRVSWIGDPFDAKLDIKAIYKLETSASALMAPASAGLDDSAKGKYRQVVPFYVYLNIDGELMQPEISFQLDMPEDEQGAVGGQIYGRVQQINQQEDELNRQVFSLLVLNRFYPDPGSDGSTGGVASIARDNLNDAISDQLNVFSDKIFGTGGFTVDLSLDSYTDYQGDTPQDRTQLDIAAQKKLFNDRLIVRVGSEVDLQGSNPTGEATPLIGNVSIEYILTENGRYRIKGFRRSEFENVIDGQTIVSGLALIFTKEFNKFSELWDALVKSSTKKEEAEKAALEQAEKEQEAKEEEVNESMEKKKE